MNPPSLSVIVPVLNEDQSLEELHARLSASIPADSEILFVDDGSTDGTRGVLGKIAAGDSRVRVIRFRRNFGKSMALEAGFRKSRGKVVVTIDADLQDDPGEIPRLIQKLDEGYDLVGGWRRRRRDPRGKVLGSRIFNFIVSVLGGVRLRDVNCGLKVLRREVLDDIVLAGGFHRFIPLLAHWRGYRVGEVDVAHSPRRHGKSRYRGDRIPQGLLDLLAVTFLLRFEGRPSRYFAGLGIALGLSGFAISAYLACLRIITGSIRSQFPLLALGLVLLVVGIQLFSLGLFGELLAYHFRSRRPFSPASWISETESGEMDPSSGEEPPDVPAARREP